MSDDRRPSEFDQLADRARNVAVGLANTGLTQAEEMLRRVSPEGRAAARRAREARQRARRPVVVASIASALILLGAGTAGATPITVLAMMLVLAAVIALVWFQMRPQRVSAEILVRRTPLAQLPMQANNWLDAQRRALPAPALPLADALGHRLAEMEPQLARLSPQEPAAEAVRKLIATELPALVEGWRGVPPSLRGEPQADGRTPDAQLVDGLRVIDGEVARMTEQLARGALDEVATQGRYLELKYRG